jgi:hypothetical protein
MVSTLMSRQLVCCGCTLYDKPDAMRIVCCKAMFREGCSNLATCVNSKTAAWMGMEEAVEHRG